MSLRFPERDRLASLGCRPLQRRCAFLAVECNPTAVPFRHRAKPRDDGAESERCGNYTGGDSDAPERAFRRARPESPDCLTGHAVANARRPAEAAGEEHDRRVMHRQLSCVRAAA